MNSESHNEALRRLGSTVKDLYGEADTVSSSDDDLGQSIDDLCPLYNAICSITDRYQDPERIGQGGTKDVYRVFDARAARYVALAKPLAEFSHDQYDAFLREAHLTARLEHPCIIDLFDMDVDDEGRPFFTMELKLGRSLRAVLEQLRQGNETDVFPLRRRLSIFSRVCEAIAYAHSRRVLHLDIKPDNIQIGEFGETQVCDWGMGVVMPHDGEQPDSEVLLDPDLYGSLLNRVEGTPIYMAPEQMSKKALKTPQMDIYALGCLLHELITLNPSITPQAHPSKIDFALTAIVAKATAGHPADRYRDVNSLLEDVSRYLAGFSTSVERSSFVREAFLFYRRHRGICAVAFAALAILALCVSLFVVQLRLERKTAIDARNEADKERAEAEVARTVAEKALGDAEIARIEAEKAEVRAVDSLAKYVAEKTMPEDRLQRQVSAAVYQADYVTSLPLVQKGSFQQSVNLSMEQLDSVIANEPTADSPVWLQKFWLSFLIQDFETTQQLVQEGKVIEDDLVQHSQKYSEYRNVDGYLDTDHFISLIQDMCQTGKRRAPLAEKMLVYDSKHSRPVSDKVRIVRAWVRIHNPQWKNGELSFDPKTGALRLRGEGLKSLRRTLIPNWPTGVKLNLLFLLNPKSLDLRQTQIRDLKELAGLELHELDIRQTPVADLSPLRKSRTLRRVMIEPDQFPASQVNKLPESIKVVESGAS